MTKPKFHDVPCRAAGETAVRGIVSQDGLHFASWFVMATELVVMPDHAWLEQDCEFVVFDKLRNRAELSIVNGAVVQAAFGSRLVDADQCLYQTELAVVSNELPMIRRFDRNTREELPSLPITGTGGTASLGFSRDGRYLSVGTYHGMLSVWQLDGDRPYLVWQGNLSQLPLPELEICQCAVTAAAFADGNSSLHVLADYHNLLPLPLFGSSILPQHLLRTTFPCHCLSSHPDKPVLALAGSGADIVIVAVGNSKQNCRLPVISQAIAAAQDVQAVPQAAGHRLPTAPVYKLYSYCGQPVAEPYPYSSLLHTDVGKKVQQLLFMDDGKLVVVGNRAVEVYDLEANASCACIARYACSGQVLAATVYGNDIFVLSASQPRVLPDLYAPM